MTPLSEETLRRAAVLFPDPGARASACQLLLTGCEDERIRIAALKVSAGNYARLRSAVQLAQVDFRDLLMAAGFAYDTSAHLQWEPQPPLNSD